MNISEYNFCIFLIDANREPNDRCLTTESRISWSTHSVYVNNTIGPHALFEEGDFKDPRLALFEEVYMDLRGRRLANIKLLRAPTTPRVVLPSALTVAVSVYCVFQNVSSRTYHI